MVRHVFLVYLSYCTQTDNADTEFVVFWVVVPCSMVAECQGFGGLCCLHLQGEVRGETKIDIYIGQI
jgi:hypothetical protein